MLKIILFSYTQKYTFIEKVGKDNKTYHATSTHKYKDTFENVNCLYFLFEQL